MENTLRQGDIFLAAEAAYTLRLPLTGEKVLAMGEPVYGDIIVFTHPRIRSDSYVKRVAGLPGDVLEMRDKQLYRNGIIVKEPYALHSDREILATRDTMPPLTVPAGAVFVLGDNRDFSEDSRFFGCVDVADIQGRVFGVYWRARTGVPSGAGGTPPLR